MAPRPFAAKLPPMTSDEQAVRGQRISDRIEAGEFGIKEVADEAGVSRQTIYNAQKGKAPDSIDAIELALDTLEDRKAHPADYADVKRSGEMSTTAEPTPIQAGLIEFEITGDFGVRVVARGPVADHELLAADVARIVRDIRATTPPSPDQAEGSPSSD